MQLLRDIDSISVNLRRNCRPRRDLQKKRRRALRNRR
jgi:hypothetical protein